MHRSGAGLLVVVQETPLRTGRLDVLYALDRLDQQAVQVGLLNEVGAGGTAQRALDQPRAEQDQRHRQHHHPAQRAADHESHRDEDQDEREV